MFGKNLKRKEESLAGLDWSHQCSKTGKKIHSKRLLLFVVSEGQYGGIEEGNSVQEEWMTVWCREEKKEGEEMDKRRRNERGETKGVTMAELQ